ncbi:MAG: glycosyltransferase, partial [Nitrosomonas ureae]
PHAHYIYLSHPEFTNDTSLQINSSKSELKILILGALTIAKGLKLLEACAIDAKHSKLPLFFQVLGYPVDEATTESEIPLSFSGRYQDTELPTLIARERADIIFFPALWPETYSYTLSYAMNSGLPIAAPKLGAFQERLAEYPAAFLLEWTSTAEDLNALFVSLLSNQPQKSALNNENE